MTHWKRPWCWEGLGAGAGGDDRGWDGWMASLTRWTWVWVNSGSWWWTGRPGMLRFMGLRRVGHDWVTELTDWLRPFRYDLNQIPYDYTGSDKYFQGIRSYKECLKNYAWRFITLNRKEAVIKTIPKKKKCKKAKWLSKETLQIAEKRREAKGNR